ncbi:LPS-induced tumor necrosis factor alpha factor [Penicillium sp. DV-2018c]|nr:LPS-induced tumor necrosis factor alpha factor [Penicillium sp. DV-2018c]KAJ5566461.1 LPS-induced tumor necrosis factor alpha factor [Penicillium sp. DV-2018c]
MEQNNISTMVSAPQTNGNNTDPAIVTVPTVTPPTDTTPSHTAPEATPSDLPERRPLAAEGPMAILPVADAPPPQYDEHKNHEPLPTEPAPKVNQAGPAPQGQGLLNPQTQVIPVAQLGEDPRRIQCPFCNQEAMTRTSKDPSGTTFLGAICCCILGGCICAFLPFCMQMCHDTHHYCTNCGSQVATSPHDGPVELFSPQVPGSVVAAPGLIRPPREAVMKN